MGTLYGREPALIITAVQALIALAIGFGLPLTGEQVSLIMAAVIAILGVVIRQTVYAPSNVEQFLEDTKHLGGDR